MATKRKLIEPRQGDKRYVRRDTKGRFNESDDVGRSLSQDRRLKGEHDREAGSGRPWRPAAGRTLATIAHTLSDADR